MGVIHPQPAGGEQLQTNGKKLRTLVTKGLYADQLVETAARPRGTLVAGYGYVLSWSLNRVNGDIGVATYQLAAQTSEQWQSNEALSDLWALKHMRVEIPVERYGGPSEVNNASLYDLARWQTEPDKALYSAYKYKGKGNTVVELTAYTIKLADKIKAGHESVVRHFPVVTRTRIYANPPTTGVGADIDHIDSPGEYASAAAAWLKIQDDIAGSADGNHTRVEGWQGAETWDENFYGETPTRWEFGSI